MKHAILLHSNPRVGPVKVTVTEELPDGSVRGVFADYQTISGTPMTPDEIREVEAEQERERERFANLPESPWP